MNKLHRGGLAALLVVVVLAAALAQAAAGFILAQRSLRLDETERLSRVADAALARAEEVTRSLSSALAEIARVAGEPCTASYLTELRRIALMHRQVRDAGAYGNDGRLQCSSLRGAHGPEAASPDAERLPPPDWRGSDGLSARSPCCSSRPFSPGILTSVITHAMSSRPGSARSAAPSS